MGQSISLVGTWIQQLAISWLVYRLTGSAIYLGLITFAAHFPGFLCAPFAGALADRISRHRLVMLTQTLAMIQAFLLAFLTLGGHIHIWHVIVFSIFIGLVSGVDIPVRQSFVVDLLEKPEDLGNAIALNSTVFNATRLVGPAISGVMVATLGEGLCFLINGISFLAVILALSQMKLSVKPKPTEQMSFLDSLRAGFRYAYQSQPIKAILLLVSLISFLGLPYATLMPIVAKDVLHGDAMLLGALMGASGVGALLGALYLASRKSAQGLSRKLVIAACVFGFSLMLFSISKTPWLSLVLMMFVGYGMMVQLGASNILLQTMVADAQRGRIMSLYTMAFIGFMPMGSLLMGILAARIGAMPTLAAGGFICLVGSLWFARDLPPAPGLIHPVQAKTGTSQSANLFGIK